MLAPILVLSSTISPNLGEINTNLINRVYQSSEEKRPYVRVYSSSQLISNDDLDVSKDSNPAYWIKHPEELIKNLKIAYDDVIQQFVDDLNGIGVLDENSLPVDTIETQSGQ